ncbi:MAG TPA: ATP-binding cassette domain-containing protein [Desulfobacterales bacterium]|nr:ATP-binding cassette domain-containing protein [Desulfobacterales bacterium]
MAVRQRLCRPSDFISEIIMLEVKIKKRMPGFELQVSFSCLDGGITVLTGPSGAGKTTLIRIMAGLTKADEGCIVHNGTVWFDSVSRVNLLPRQRKIGYVFQEHTLFPHLTIAGNINLISNDRAETDRLLGLFKIRHIAARRPYQVSGGERQRAAFAQALARKPEALFLDEPFSALDITTRGRLQEELLKLKTTLSIPIVHVTHDPDEAGLLADCTVEINREFAASAPVFSAAGFTRRRCWPRINVSDQLTTPNFI